MWLLAATELVHFIQVIQFAHTELFLIFSAWKFKSPLVFPSHMTRVGSFSTLLGIFFFQLPSSLLFSFVYIAMSSCSDILSHLQSPFKPLKNIFLYVTLCICSIYFLFFLGLPCLCFYCLSLHPINFMHMSPRSMNHVCLKFMVWQFQHSCHIWFWYFPALSLQIVPYAF